MTQEPTCSVETLKAATLLLASGYTPWVVEKLLDGDLDRDYNGHFNPEDYEKGSDDHLVATMFGDVLDQLDNNIDRDAAFALAYKELYQGQAKPSIPSEVIEALFALLRSAYPTSFAHDDYSHCFYDLEVACSYDYAAEAPIYDWLGDIRDPNRGHRLLALYHAALEANPDDHPDLTAMFGKPEFFALLTNEQIQWVHQNAINSVHGRLLDRLDRIRELLEKTDTNIQVIDANSVRMKQTLGSISLKEGSAMAHTLLYGRPVEPDDLEQFFTSSGLNEDAFDTYFSDILDAEPSDFADHRIFCRRGDLLTYDQVEEELVEKGVEL